MRRILVVDLCGTLVRENTTHGFLKALQAPFGTWQRRLLLSGVGLPVAGWVVPSGLRPRLIASLRGIRKEELERQAMAYARQALERAGRHELLLRLREPDVEPVLASASLDVVVGSFATLLGVRQWLATQLEYDGAGVCQGRILRDATGCKRRLLEELLGCPLVGHMVITDNAEDIDLKQDASSFEYLDATDT